MAYYADDDEIMREARQNKAALLQEFGGIAGLLEYMDTERPALEKQGWKFVDSKEIYSKNLQRQIAGEGTSRFA
jgi:hypothetical protein